MDTKITDIKITSQSPEDTKALGRRLGDILKGGDVLSLRGELGAGKTAFAQGVGESLGITDPLTSPTFTLLQEYSAKAEGQQSIRLIHMDLYRLQHPEEVEVIGVEDAFQSDTICLIEWPEIAEDYLPADRLDLTIEGSGDTPRTLHFKTMTRQWEDRLKIFRGDGDQ